MGTRYRVKGQFESGGITWTCYPFTALEERYTVARLPYSLKILLENLLRHGNEVFVRDADVEALAGWDAKAEPTQEIAFVPARVLLQDFTGVPAVVDLAAMREAMVRLGGDPAKINPLNPVELVIDHSVMVDVYGRADALERNTAIEFERNSERYQFLRWGQQAFDNFKVVPPGTGIVHQVNLEYLARGVFTRERNGEREAWPDTLVGTDSHTTMINGLGVLGWGVGGIEAEAAMLGQPVSMLIPQVVGVCLRGRPAPGTTATDLVLTVTEMLRQHGVVGKFVEFFGPGLKHLSLADRATIGNMAPEYGATCGIFPMDAETIRYLRLTGRDESQLRLIEDYMKAMGLWHSDDSVEADYSAVLELDLSRIEPSLAGPKRPQDRIPLSQVHSSFARSLQEHLELNLLPEEATNFAAEGGSVRGNPLTGAVEVEHEGKRFTLEHGAVVIAAITSCTNTSNPAVLVAAGLLARKARQAGLRPPPWVKTSLAPGSRVVTDYLRHSGLLDDLEALGFYLVGYGCTTCIGNSGPLAEPISRAINSGRLLVGAVLSGNRNFEGRIHQDVRANYLASPPLVVAYALAGNMQVDLATQPLGTGSDGKPIYLADIWPGSEEIQELVTRHLSAEQFRRTYAEVYSGNAEWNALPVKAEPRYDWPASTYVRHPPFFSNMGAAVPEVRAIEAAHCLVKVGDSVTTDHISPAGGIAVDSPAGQWLLEQGVGPGAFNSYGSRRGNHEVMMRGTFANVRLRNQLAPGSEGSWTTHFPSGERLSIFDAAQRYRAEGRPLVVLAGKEYGTGSSRDWAAKGPALLGVRAVIAESYERIHRSNLVGMGILPLQYAEGVNAATLGLDGTEQFSIEAIGKGQTETRVRVQRSDGRQFDFAVRVRIDTPNEYDYFRHGGILHYVLRKLA